MVKKLSWKDSLPDSVEICKGAPAIACSEAVMQESFFAILQALLPAYPILRWVFHVPNEGTGSARRGAKMKRAGVVSGVWDISCDSPSNDGRYARLRIELKAGANRLSPAQIDWANYYDLLGGSRLAVCYSAETAWKVVADYFNISEGGL